MSTGTSLQPAGDFFNPQPIWIGPTQITSGWISLGLLPELKLQIGEKDMMNLEMAWKIAMALVEKQMVKADTVPEFIALVNTILDAGRVK